jgi:NAD(P)-dependent dehydrogenase (short-subunit alcohol dehydrogenase family)
MKRDLRGQTALITGGSKGIGYGVAEALVKEGANVTITARNESEVRAAADNLTSIGPGQALGLRCDVRDLAEQEQVVARTLERFGRLDVLVANAGVGRFGSVAELTPEAWQEVIDTNLTGVFYSVKAALAPIVEAQGFIFTISSLAGKNPFAGGSAYNASKFGLNGFSEAIMLDLRHQGVRVSTIMPGSVATYFNAHTPSEQDAWKIQPEDIGEMIVYLLRVDSRTLPSRIEVRPSQPPKR